MNNIKTDDIILNAIELYGKIKIKYCIITMFTKITNNTYFTSGRGYIQIYELEEYLIRFQNIISEMNQSQLIELQHKMLTYDEAFKDVIELELSPLLIVSNINDITLDINTRYDILDRYLSKQNQTLVS